jgi:adenine phosphoribosyltransferase
MIAVALGDGGRMPDRERVLRDLRGLIRDVPDFPVPGILFRDITPIFQDPESFRSCVALFVDYFRSRRVDVFAGIESRGFLFAAPVALELGAAFVPVRKLGKLPAAKLQRTYSLEYGTATIEVHRDAVRRGQRVALVDDLLATGGTAEAACSLLEEAGGEVIDVAFLIELDFLAGRERLRGRTVTSFIHY